MPKEIIIQARKYGGILHYEWPVSLLEEMGTSIVVRGKRGRRLHHYTKEAVFTMEHDSVEWFSTEHWFTVSAEVRNGEIYQYYCNINQPAVREGDSLVSFIDLDLDLICRSGVWQVVDEEEFAHNEVKYNYPAELTDRTRKELGRLQERIRLKQFPFDGTIERHVKQLSGEKE